jgi:hypothetical protein
VSSECPLRAQRRPSGVGMLRCNLLCCGALRGAALRHGALRCAVMQQAQGVATRCAGLQHVVLCCNTLCCVATRCAVLQIGGGCAARVKHADAIVARLSGLGSRSGACCMMPSSLPAASLWLYFARCMVHVACCMLHASCELHACFVRASCFMLGGWMLHGAAAGTQRYPAPPCSTR